MESDHWTDDAKSIEINVYSKQIGVVQPNSFLFGNSESNSMETKMAF